MFVSRLSLVFPGSSMVEQVAVNHLVTGSSPVPGAFITGLFFFRGGQLLLCGLVVLVLSILLNNMEERIKWQKVRYEINKKTFFVVCKF